MKKQYLLGIDVGTQSLKVGIYTVDGYQVWLGQENYRTTLSKRLYAEQNPYDWWKAFKSVMERCRRDVDVSQVAAISVCATSSTVLVVDASGTPVIPSAMLWMDRRSHREAKEINMNDQQEVKEILKYSGGKVSEEWMTPKSMWIKKNVPLKSGWKIVEQLDWFNYRLTGNWVASQCNATCKWNYVKSHRGFSKPFFACIGWSEFEEYWILDVRQVGEEVGRVTKQVAQEIGLLEGTPVYQGGIDAHIGMLGSGAVENGEMSLVMGTSFVQLVHVSSPMFKEGLWGPYEAPLIPGKWLLEGGQISSGSIISWFMNQFYSEFPSSHHGSIFEDLNREIQQIRPGCDGLVILDSWQGNRTPYGNALATGNIFGLQLKHTKYHIYRAILESIAYGTRNNIEYFRKAGAFVTKIIAGGGGAKNHFWLQMISDITGVECITVDGIEAGTKGCAVVAAFGLGCYRNLKEASKRMTHISERFTPDRSIYAEYNEVFQLYLRLFEQLMPLMGRNHEHFALQKNANEPKIVGGANG